MRIEKKHITTTLLLGALSAVPVAGFAATPPTAQTPTAAKQASTHSATAHATRGIVKSIDAASLVITRSGGNHPEMSFALNPSTHRDGTITAGTPVSVRYREEGKTHVATAIQVQPAKQQATRTTTPKR